MKKNKIIILIVVLIAILSLLIYWQANLKIKKSEFTLSDKQRNLTVEQVKFYNDRIAKAEEFSKSLVQSDVNYKQNLLNNYIYLGQQYFGLGKLDKSKQMFENAVSINPSEVQCYVGLAMVYEDSGDFNKQIEALKKATELAPKNSDVWVRYLNLRKERGASFSEMEELYANALEKTERYVDIIVSYATYKGENGDVEGAIKLWQEAMLKYPANSSLYQIEINKYKSKK